VPPCFVNILNLLTVVFRRRYIFLIYLLHLIVKIFIYHFVIITESSYHNFDKQPQNSYPLHLIGSSKVPNSFHLFFCSVLISTTQLFAQSSNDLPFKTTLKGYATYRQYQTFENVATTLPIWKRETDLRAFEIKGEYYITPKSELEFEVEFEHGGTGSSLEYDQLEEFGEFEAEHEKGGEVVLSEFYYRHAMENQTWIKVGKIPVYISIGNIQENYLLHPTILPSSAEQNMVPSEWRELGIELQKRFGAYNVRGSVMNGLNSEFFRKYNWIGGGYQKQFESSNSGSLAGTLAFEYGDVAFDDGVVASVYYGEVTGNRNKNRKINGEASLLMGSVLGVWHTELWGQNFGFRGQFIHGTLSRSDEISLANATLTSSANPGAFSALGHEAQLEMAEVSYDIYENDDEKMTAYYNYQHVDTMKSVEGSILKDDRYNRVTSSFGLLQKWEKIMFVKAEYATHSNAQAELPTTNEYQLAFGFDWKGFNL
jgi:hypothetical protein